MNRNWPTRKLGDVALRIGGGTPAREDASYWGGDLPWFTVADLSNVDAIQDLTISRENITRVGLARSAAKLVPRGAVVFSTRVVVGKVGIAQNELATNQDFSSFVPISDLDSQFLAYFLLRAKYSLREDQRGATIKGITTKILDRLDIPLPPIDEQRRIVARIKECMERVEEIKRLSNELAEECDALKYATVSQVITELREAHAGKTIGQILVADKSAMRSGPFGSAMKHGDFVDDGNLVIGIANVQENQFDPVRKWMINEKKYSEMRRYQVEPGDLLITVMGTIGRACVVPDNVGKAITSKHVYRIRLPRVRVLPEFVSYIINYDLDTRAKLYGAAIGCVMPGLNASKLRDLNVCLPPIALQAQTVSRLDEAHAALRERATLAPTTELSFLRDAILRKAFAGEL